MARRNIIEKVQAWAKERGLDKCHPEDQYEKLLEECQELTEALESYDGPDMIDAIGDIQVVLIVMCLQIGLDFDGCLLSAYEEIKDRKGRIVEGVFIKEIEK